MLFEKDEKAGLFTLRKKSRTRRVFFQQKRMKKWGGGEGQQKKDKKEQNRVFLKIRKRRVRIRNNEFFYLSKEKPPQKISHCLSINCYIGTVCTGSTVTYIQSYDNNAKQYFFV